VDQRCPNYIGAVQEFQIVNIIIVFLLEEPSNLVILEGLLKKSTLNVMVTSTIYRQDGKSLETKTGLLQQIKELLLLVIVVLAMLIQA
tara:strand:- start:520 stop:783 length:264 start_codon:yes stop_codon:yes gene_type:complete